MDINELQRFTGKGHNVFLHYLGEYGSKEWLIKLEAKHAGTKLEITAKGATPEEAFKEAAEKFYRATFSGLPEMNPSLTYDARVEPQENFHTKEPYPEVDRDDGVPF